MATGVELATAYVSLVPSTRGIHGQISKELGGPLESEGRKGGSRLGGALMAGVKKVGMGAAVATGAALTGALVKGWGRLTAIDDAEAKLRGLGHSAEGIDAIMDSALAAVKGTAFGLGDAAGLAATIVASGIKPGEDLTRILTLVGDSATIAGVGLDDMGLIWGKVAAKGKVDGQIINQMLERQVPILEYLAAHYDTTAEKAAEMVSDGKVSFEDFAAAMEANVSGAALESGSTVRGALANMGAALGRFGASLLSGVFSKLPDLFGRVIGVLDMLTPVAADLGEKLGAVLADAVDWLVSLDFSGWLEALSGPAERITEVFERMAPIVSDVLVAAFEALADLLSRFLDVAVPLATTLGGHLLTALEGVASATEWVQRNWTTLKPILIGVGTLITAVLIPHWIRLGIQATIASVKNVAAWVAGRAAAVKSAAVQVASSYKVIAGWMRQGAAAVVSGAQTVAVWAMYKAEAIKAAAVQVAQSARIAATWAMMQARAMASAIRQAVAWAIGILTPAAAAVTAMALTAARVVAGWVLMGAQSLIHAAKVAAAWVIAMGPIAIIIAAVVAVAAIIITNFDTIKRVIGAAWDWIKSATGAAWDWIKSITGAAWDWVTSKIGAFLTWMEGAFSGAFGAARDAAQWVWDKLKSLGSWLSDTFKGLVSGVSGAWDTLKGAIDGVAGFASSAFDGLVSAINSLIGPLQTAVGWARSLYNGIKEALRIGGSVPGSMSFVAAAAAQKLGEFHSGGVVPGRRGQEVPILAMAGETVLPTHDPSWRLQIASDPNRRRGRGDVNFNGDVHVGDRRDLRELDWWARTEMAGI